RRLDPKLLESGLVRMESIVSAQDTSAAVALLSELVVEAELTSKPRLGSLSRRLAVVPGGRES
ncbi:MAG: hypothetical protein KDA24_10305, partial [Deltaproteobacteria bacterium]|nr:hypothetical protein [Deltaproteobacteria bacterium]